MINLFLWMKINLFLRIVSCFSPKRRTKKKKPIPIKYEAGDLVWAKFKRRPWWPCKICHDPVLDTHSKMKGNVFVILHGWRLNTINCGCSCGDIVNSVEKPYLPYIAFYY